MEPDDIKAVQETCDARFYDAPFGMTVEALWMQNRLLAEIAIQLAKLNEHLANPPMQYASEDEAMQAFLGQEERKKEVQPQTK